MFPAMLELTGYSAAYEQFCTPILHTPGLPINQTLPLSVKNSSSVVYARVRGGASKYCEKFVIAFDGARCVKDRVSVVIVEWIANAVMSVLTCAALPFDTSPKSGCAKKYATFAVVLVASKPVPASVILNESLLKVGICWHPGPTQLQLGWLELVHVVVAVLRKDREF